MSDRLPPSGPGLSEANVARQRARRVPPKPAIVGGVDEPGLRSLTRGERLLPFVDLRSGLNFHFPWLDKLDPECAFRITSTIRCSRPEMNN